MRVLIVAPEQLTRDAYTALLQTHRILVVGVSGSTREIISRARQEEADVILIDSHRLDDRDYEFYNGAQMYGELNTVVIVDAEAAAPINGTAVLRSCSAEELCRTLRQVAGPSIRQPRRGRGRPRNTTNGLELSTREYSVALLIARGESNQAIAKQLSLKEQSVKNLVSTIIRKLRCENRVQVALLMERHKSEQLTSV